MIFIIFSIVTAYTVLIIGFIIGFDKVKNISNTNTAPKHSFSIVVPFRNEAKNLPHLLNNIQQLNYPKHLFEILFVNDASDDDSSDLVKKYQQQFPLINIVLLNNLVKSNAPKKDAINTAIKNAKFTWIVTTDADCKIPPSWLQVFNQFIELKNPVFISAPVKMEVKSSILKHYQHFNMLSLQGATIGSFGLKNPLMCNGANLCYKKNIFNELKGFEGNENIASGDDVFLLEKMATYYPKQTFFLKSKSAIVSTTSEKNWNSYINQQIRWASKATAYKSSFSKFTGIVVLLMNLLLLILPFIAFKSTIFLTLFFIIFTQKIIIDFILIQKTATFLQSKTSLKNYLKTVCLYPLLTTLIGLTSIFKGYEWKGRSYKK